MATLNPNLRDFWTTRETPDGDPVRFRVLHGGRMSSKCLAVGTGILMYDGTVKAVEDVQVGDKVMGPDSNHREVLNTCRGLDEMYRVSQSYGQDYVVNSNHILSLRKTPSADKDITESTANKRIYRYFPDLPPLLNIGVSEFVERAKSSKFRNVFKGWKVGQQYQSQPVPLDPYFLGVWLGDGDSARPCITTIDPEVAQYVTAYGESQGMTVRASGKSGTLAMRYNIVGVGRANDVLNTIQSLDLIRYVKAQDRETGVQYTGNKHIPQCYITNDESTRFKLLAGLIDSDGTFVARKGCYVITQINERLIGDIKRLADSLGFRTNVGTNDNVKFRVGDEYVTYGKIVHRLSISGPRLEQIPTLLARKQAKVSTHVANQRPYTMTSLTVDPIGIGEYAGFEVDGDHLFCLSDGTVTHNSHDMAGVAIARANFSTERFLCLRMFQNRIADSVYTLLKDKISYFELDKNFKIYADAIEHKTNGSLFRFYGVARNVDEIKSFEGATVSWWEEAHLMTESAFNTVRPTVMRNDGAEMWFSFNARFATDFAWKRLVISPPRGTLIRQINYDENPFLSPSALADIESAFEEDYDLAIHTYKGVPFDSDDSVVIKRAWLQSAVDAHKTVKPLSGTWTGGKTVGYDVADDGDDKNATTAMDGMVCIDLDEWKGGQDELRESAARVKMTAERLQASQIGYDSIGVGAGTGSHLNSLGWRRHYRFNAGGKVSDPKRHYGDTKITNEDFFANLKAQAWWLAADRFRNTHLAVTKGRQFPADQMISLSSECDAKLLNKLIDELSTPMRDFDNAGKVKVESKKDLAKREIVSPNIADSFIIAACRGMLAKVPIGNML